MVAHTTATEGDVVAPVAPRLPARWTAIAVGVLAGAVLLGVSALKDRTLPSWTVPPFLAAALGGLIAFAVDLGSTGAALWALFGLGWVWLGAVVFVWDVFGLAARLLGKSGGRRAAKPYGESG